MEHNVIHKVEIKPFKTLRQFKRCAKAFALLIAYHNPNCDDASDDFTQCVFDYTERELEKMKLPNGWREHSSTYNEFTDWFIKNS